MKISSLLLVLLAQLGGCARFLCSLPVEEKFEAHRLSIANPLVENIAPLSGDDFVVVARPPGAPTSMEVTRVRANREEIIASIPRYFLSDVRPSVFTRQEHWWFGTQGYEGAISTVYFVVGGEPNQQARVKLPRQYPLVWLPIRGDDPLALEVSVTNEQPALRIDEVTPSGVKPIGAFPWSETALPLSSRWSAEQLGDGRFAIVAVDGPDGAMTLKLRVGGGAEPVESAIPCAVAIDYPLATAVEPSGRLAVVGVSKEGRVVAMIVDVDHAQSTRCSVISAPGEVAARPPFGTPAVVPTGESFVTAWIRDDGMVRACELGNLRVPPLIVDVGEGADVDRPLHQLLYPDDEYVTFVWKEHGGGFVLRRMPKSLAGYELAAELWRLLCAVFDSEETDPAVPGIVRPQV